MSGKPYYLAYENRYRAVYAAGIERWGHSPDDETLISTLTKWAETHCLPGKKVIEFACGEGACGEILSGLGCIYHGVDIAPSAVEKARKALERYPAATVSLLDMVNGQITDSYDAAIDIMGFHMLVTDADRRKYLQNAFKCLRPGAPMLFFRESYRRDLSAFNKPIDTIEQWVALTGEDYGTPQIRKVSQNGKEAEVSVPLVPARARDKEGYINDFSGAGFVVDEFIETEANEEIIYSASIFVHKPFI